MFILHGHIITLTCYPSKPISLIWAFFAFNKSFLSSPI
ncbi:Hypothetical protein LLA12_01539 [Lactococcus lactis subsp. lactis]|nr:Hypothetical protein LLA12_01539 [Lactococcus lactis subsp. lactis]